MVEYGVAVGGVAGGGYSSGYGGGYGSSGFTNQIETLSSDPLAWIIAAALILVVVKFVR